MAEQFSWVPLAYCSPPGCPFPIKSLALSARVSSEILFRVLDKSPVLGPGKGILFPATGISQRCCFPSGSDGKESTCNAEDPGSISGLRSSPGERNGNPLQYSCLENPMDRGAWWATVHAVAELDRTEPLTLNFLKERIFAFTTWLTGARGLTFSLSWHSTCLSHSA